jgi:hypothetical protein
MLFKGSNNLVQIYRSFSITGNYVSTATFFFAPLWRMGPRCNSAETQVCHRSYIIAARSPLEEQFCVFKIFKMSAIFKMTTKTRHNKWVVKIQHCPMCRATTRSHSSQWSKKKSCSWNIKTHSLRFKHFIITITDLMIPVLVKSVWLRNICFSKVATTSELLTPAFINNKT